LLAVTVLTVAAVGLLLGRLVVGPLEGPVSRDIDTPARSLSLDHPNPSIDRVAADVSTLGNATVSGTVGVAAAALWWLRTRNARPALILFATFTGALVVAVLVKFGVHRSPASGPTRSLSGTFPSGHTLFAVAVYGTLAILFMRATRLPVALRMIVTLLLVVIPIAVGWARVYRLDHYLSDVLASVVLGMALVAGVLAVIPPVRPSRHRA
jgi:undecaprenyl-diphosphatase